MTDSGGTSALDLLSVYRSVYEIRMFEETARELRRRGEITCSVHLCIGQEQVAVAARAALADSDVVFGTYRGHHWAIACGVPVGELFMEFMGCEDGINGGRAGAGLLIAPDHGFLGENGIVGAGAPIAVGAALATRFDGSDRVSLVAFGDGALNQGAVHEAMNFAAVFELGVVFVCENNGYSEYTPTEAMFKIQRLADRAAAYGFPGETVDGADPREIHDAVRRAARRARAGEGPTLLDVHVRRLEGHHTHDPEHYRPSGQKAAWHAADPMIGLRQRLRAEGSDEAVIVRLENEVQGMIDAAVARARLAKPADPGSVLAHVYR
jgi:TPP-dependent pyruvate/acetoin dehydrogenase alpha subunit